MGIVFIPFTCLTSCGWLVHRILRIHLGLNYSFTLNKVYHIDSARVGNETRYINHGEGDEANATAISVLLWHKVYGPLSLIAYLEKLVLGDLRIAFYSCTSKLSRCRYFSRLTRHNRRSAKYQGQ